MYTDKPWKNWAGNVQSSPIKVIRPTSIDQLAENIAGAHHAQHTVKVIGAGHSFSPIAATEGVQVSLDRLSGIESVIPNENGALVTVFAGTRLYELNPQLWELGYAMTNLGDIDQQSVAGAISTATHGTGARFGGIATQVRKLQLLTAAGTILELDAENNPDVFDAARVSLGALGIITKVTLQVSPAFALKAVEVPKTLDQIFANLSETVAHSDHFEFYWFPHTRNVLTKTNTRLPIDTPLAPLSRTRFYLEEELLANKLFEQINRFATKFPSATAQLNKFTSRALSAREYTDRSYRVFASAREVRFREMEYALPVDAVQQVITETEAWLARSGETISFPVEVRFTQADDIWLSTASGRATAYVAVHQYHRQDHTRYFNAFEEIAKSVGGRPHWGKIHTLNYADLKSVYPHLDDFISVRNQLDPHRVFSNTYLNKVLGH